MVLALWLAWSGFDRILHGRPNMGFARNSLTHPPRHIMGVTPTTSPAAHRGGFLLETAMSNVVNLNVITTLPLDPDRLLERAIGQLDRVLILGIDKDGDEYFASSDPDGGTAIWDMERAKLKLLRLADKDET